MKAIKLANEFRTTMTREVMISWGSDAAIELRSLAEVNAELVTALENMITASLPDETYGHCTSDIENAAYFARGVLAKAKEQQ